MNPIAAVFGSVAATTFIVTCILTIYFLPTVIATAGNRKNTLLIFILNAFLGWTGIAWIILFIWAIVDEKKYVL